MSASYLDDWHANMATSMRHAGSSVDATMCVDAMQFAEPCEAGLAECFRVLAPRGRLVLTGRQQAERAMWQAAVAADSAGDPSLQSLHDEGVRTMPIIDIVDRMLVTAGRPGPASADL